MNKYSSYSNGISNFKITNIRVGLGRVDQAPFPFTAKEWECDETVVEKESGTLEREVVTKMNEIYSEEIDAEGSIGSGKVGKVIDAAVYGGSEVVEEIDIGIRAQEMECRVGTKTGQGGGLDSILANLIRPAARNLFCSKRKAICVDWVNGEIYNHEMLRKQLSNHKFRTGSDFEVIAHLYKEHGEEFTNMLDDIFSFVLLDTRDKKVQENLA